MKKLLLIYLFLFVISLQSQDYFPTNTGVKTSFTNAVAFKNATIYITPKKIIKKGTLLIQNDKVIAFGKKVKIPKGTKTIDLKGKTIYPSFIDLYSSFGIPKPKKSLLQRGGSKPQYDAERNGFYWNDHIRSETEASTFFKFDSKKAIDYLKAGFVL